VPVVGLVGAGTMPTGGGVITLSPLQPVSTAMMQSVESVAYLVVMESSRFELTHISPKTALPLRTRPERPPAHILMSVLSGGVTQAKFGHSYTLLY
jgi:hypothetical protein